MQNGPDHKKHRKGKRPRSPPPPDLPFGLRELEALKLAMQQYHQEARAAAQPFLADEVAVRKRAWKARWTGNQNGFIVSSADITELKLKMSEQRITRHEEDYLQILRDQRESDYAQAREDLVKSTLKGYNRAMFQRILRTRCNR